MKSFIYWFKLFFPLTVFALIASTILFLMSGEYEKFYIATIPTIAAVFFTIVEDRIDNRKQW